MSSKYILALVLGAFLFFTIISEVSSITCGQVFMGPDRGINRDRQSSRTRLQANWQGFNPSGRGHGTITYAYAAISSKVATQAITDSGPFAPTSKRCRSTSGLVKPADLVDFSFGNVGTNTSVQIKHQPLVLHGHYYVIIRATQANTGEVIYSNTDNIVVIRHDDDDDVPPYKQGLIAMGCAIFCLLCLYLLLILAFFVARGRGEDKYTTTVHRNENVDKL